MRAYAVFNIDDDETPASDPSNYLRPRATIWATLEEARRSVGLDQAVVIQPVELMSFDRSPEAAFQAAFAAERAQDATTKTTKGEYA